MLLFKKIKKNFKRIYDINKAMEFVQLFNKLIVIAKSIQIVKKKEESKSPFLLSLYTTSHNVSYVKAR